MIGGKCCYSGSNSNSCSVTTPPRTGWRFATAVTITTISVATIVASITATTPTPTPTGIANLLSATVSSSANATSQLLPVLVPGAIVTGTADGASCVSSTIAYGPIFVASMLASRLQATLRSRGVQGNCTGKTKAER